MSDEPPKVLISEIDIERRVGELAAQISDDYADKGEIVLIGVLKGAFILLADLSRRLSIPRSIEFIAVSSYEDGDVPSGAVRLVMDLETDIAGAQNLGSPCALVLSGVTNEEDAWEWEPAPDLIAANLTNVIRELKFPTDIES